MVRHTAGLTHFSRHTHGISHTLDVFVDADDPVKFSLLTLANDGHRVRTLSVFAYNEAIGNGANPARGGTPGGGSGGAIYLDGNLFTLDLVGSLVHDNTANEGGGAIFFVSNDRTGQLRITNSTLQHNVSRGFETAGFPGIFFLGLGSPQVVGSTIS